MLIFIHDLIEYVPVFRPFSLNTNNDVTFLMNDVGTRKEQLKANLMSVDRIRKDFRETWMWSSVNIE